MIHFKQLSMLLVLAGALKVWQPGEDVTSTDLNANFTYIKNRFVGGQGARLVDADVSPSANIATTKLAAQRFIPKAWATVETCSSGTCSIDESEQITSVTRSGTGLYQINFSYTATDVLYAVVLQAGGGSNYAFCNVNTTSTANFTLACKAVDGTTAKDTAFSFIVLDAN